MRVKYLKDMPICYDGFTRTEHKKGDIVDIKDLKLVKELIASRSVKEYNEQEEKQIAQYENKMVKKVRNKRQVKSK